MILSKFFFEKLGSKNGQGFYSFLKEFTLFVWVNKRL